MHQDEIIEEVRSARNRLLEDAGGDLEVLFAQLKGFEAVEQRPVVVRPPRRPVEKNDVA